jgi:hypothetical protein
MGAWLPRVDGFERILVLFMQFLSSKDVIKMLQSDADAWGMSDSAKRFLARDEWLRGCLQDHPCGFKISSEALTLKRLAKKAHVWMKPYLLGVKSVL